MIEYLDNAEITRVTGATKSSAQADWLKERGIPHQVDGKRIIVSRIHVQAWLEGRPTRVSTGQLEAVAAVPNAGLLQYQTERRRQAIESVMPTSEGRRRPKHGAVDRAKAAQRARSSKRRALERRQLAGWANLDAIRLIYQRAIDMTRATGIPHHVDHDIPLAGKLVSGLHVENNLQVLPAVENMRKHNRFEVAE